MRLSVLVVVGAVGCLGLVGCGSGGDKGAGGGRGSDTGAGVGDGDGDGDGDGEDAVPEEWALGLVPKPASLTLMEGRFVLDSQSTFWATGDALEVAELVADQLRVSTGYPLPVQEGDGGRAGTSDVVFEIDGATGAAESHRLLATATGLRLTGADRQGLFWATRTLLQLLPPAVLSGTVHVGTSWEVPAVEVIDEPLHGWRGGMIDVARHFFTVAEVKRQVDLFALHKLNRLHLHLTDDQGWRIEIESWPDLALIGGATQVGGGAGGFFTQDDYREIVNYAEQRGIVVIPEIDFPGHANAARSAYASLNSDGTPVAPYTGTPVITTPLDLAAPATFDMVEDVWIEVAAMTPGPWVHVGGDEAIDLSQAEYAAFMQWLQGVVEAQGKVLIGWDEVGEGELRAPYVSQYWWQSELARAAADEGATLIYSWAGECYLDMRYDSASRLGQSWAGTLNTFGAYRCLPGLTGIDNDQWLGVEAPLWTEFVATEAEMDSMLWPRLAAVAEAGWSVDPRPDWDAFRHRLGRHGHRLAALGVAYHPGTDIDWTLASP